MPTLDLPVQCWKPSLAFMKAFHLPQFESENLCSFRSLRNKIFSWLITIVFLAKSFAFYKPTKARELVFLYLAILKFRINSLEIALRKVLTLSIAIQFVKTNYFYFTLIATLVSLKNVGYYM